MYRMINYGVLGFTVLAGVGFLSGCQTVTHTKQPLLLFPPPPEKPRVQFLTWMSGADQVEPARSSFESFVLGEDAIDIRTINKPYGLAARDGVVYVCDTKSLCLTRMDFKEKTFTVIGTSGPGRLRKPINIIIDPLNYKFVVDPIRKQIVIFSPEDKYVTAFDVPEPCHPVDVALYQDELFVLDNDSTPQIVVLNRQNGEVIRTFGSKGKEPGQFNIPGSLSIDEKGFIYVSDTMNWRIQKLTRQGESVWVKGAPGYRLGTFGRPRGIRTAPDDIFYVVDGATEIVQLMNGDGEILMHFGGPGVVPGTMVLPASLAIDSTSLPYFKQYIHKDFKAEYLLFVANQYGGRLINVYAFGSFPEGYKLSESQIKTLPAIEPAGSIGPVEQHQTPEDENAKQEKSPDESKD